MMRIETGPNRIVLAMGLVVFCFIYYFSFVLPAEEMYQEHNPPLIVGVELTEADREFIAQEMGLEFRNIKSGDLLLLRNGNIHEIDRVNIHSGTITFRSRLSDIGWVLTFDQVAALDGALVTQGTSWFYELKNSFNQDVPKSDNN